MKAFWLAAVAALMFISPADAASKKSVKAKKSQPAAEKVEEAAPEPTGPVTDLKAAMATYALFQSDVSAVDGGSIKGPADLERALDKAAMLNKDALTRGWIAYQALNAAQSKEFVNEVRKVAAAYGKNKVANGLILSPGYARTIGGADEATRFVTAAADADSARVIDAGDRLKTYAMKISKVGWAKAVASSGKVRSQRIRALFRAGNGRSLDGETSARLIPAVGGGNPLDDPGKFGGQAFWSALALPASANVATATSYSKPKKYSWTSASGGQGARNAVLTLAALYAIDATDHEPSATHALLTERGTRNCMEMAQAQYYQCVASAHFNYENMACVGEAGLQSVGKCLSTITK